MAPLYDNHECYKKMLELQDKLRRSEEERIRLEERFNLLLQESRNRHDACINRLRIRYIEFLEEQRARDERNHKLLNALDRVDNSLSLITAKTDRLNILRKQYEANLVRCYASRAPGSVTGDSGIGSQNERGYAAAGNVEGVETEPSLLPTQISSRSFLNTGQNRGTNRNPVHQRTPHLLPETTSSSTSLSGVPYRANPYQDILQSHAGFPVNRNRVEHPAIARYIGSPAYSDQFYEPQSLGNAEIRSASPVIRVEDRFERGRTLQKVEANEEILPHLSANRTIPSHRLDFPSVAKSVPYSAVDNLPTNTSQPQTTIGEANPLAGSIKSAHDDVVRIGFAKENYPRKIPLPLGPDYPPNQRRDALEAGSEVTHLYDALESSDLTKRNALSRLETSSHGMPALSRKNLDADEQERTTRLLEDELDRYIGKIRNLQADFEPPRSLDEIDHEQNTSGDLLNVTLSDDGADLSDENKFKDDKMPNEVQKVLALADELASSTVKLPNEIASNGKRIDGDLEAKNQETENNQVDKISDGATRDHSELGPTSYCDVNEVAKGERDDQQHLRGANARQKYPDDNVNGYVSNISANGNRNLDEDLPDLGTENVPKDDAPESKYNLYVGRQMGLPEEEGFKAVEELEPWDIGTVEKEIYEMQLGDEEFVGKIEDACEETAANGRFEEKNIEKIGTESRQDSSERKENIPERTTLDDAKSLTEHDQYRSEVAAERNQEEYDNLKNDESSLEQSRNLDESNNHVAERSVPNEETAHYEGNRNEEYQDYPDPQEYPQTMDGEYVDYGNDERYNRYMNDPNNDYAQVPDAQWYQDDPNAQYQEESSNVEREQNLTTQYGEEANAQYEQAPNLGYVEEGPDVDVRYEQEEDRNVDYQEDPNAGYEQDPNPEYQEENPHQSQDLYDYDRQEYAAAGYENDPNGSYAYSENVSYAGEVYDNPERQESVGVYPSGNAGETDEACEAGMKEMSGENLEEDRKEADVTASAEKTNEPKKKKDVIKSLLESDTESTIERNTSNTESDFDFN